MSGVGCTVGVRGGVHGRCQGWGVRRDLGAGSTAGVGRGARRVSAAGFMVGVRGGGCTVDVGRGARRVSGEMQSGCRAGSTAGVSGRVHGGRQRRDAWRVSGEGCTAVLTGKKKTYLARLPCCLAAAPTLFLPLCPIVYMQWQRHSPIGRPDQEQTRQVRNKHL